MKNRVDDLIFKVDETSYCLWDVDIKNRNKEFLNSFDPDYFIFLFETLNNTDNDQYASIGIRTTLYQAIETLFSLIGAYLQAPYSCYAWIGKCSNKELRDIIQKINNQKNLYNVFNISNISWNDIAALIFKNSQTDSERNKQLSEAYGKLWSQIAFNFFKSINTDEYNSLKHGFRVKLGGFSLKIGFENENKPMQSMGGSKYGSSFLKISQIGKQNRSNPNITSRRTSLNWSYEQNAILLQLVYLSINNLIYALKHINGINIENHPFKNPKDISAFLKPWQYNVSPISFDMDTTVNISTDDLPTRKQIEKILLDFEQEK